MKLKLLPIITVIALIATISLAQAVATSINLLQVTWNHDPVTVYIKLQKGVDPTYKNEVITALNNWSNGLKSRTSSTAFNFEILDDPQSKKRPADITITLKKNTGVILGSTSISSQGGLIQQAKITLATQNALGLPLDSADVRNIARHEIGHALGLGHANDDGKEPIDLMAPQYDFIEVGTDTYPSELDFNALIFIYGNDGFGGNNTKLIPPTYP